MEFNMNIPDAILDEVALEGLDGITINTLWYRLENRRNFPLTLDDVSKEFIWNLLCNDESIEFFLLKDPRPPYVDYNRYNHVDPEFEIICEPEDLPEDIYPVAPVEDKAKGIRGSCATYETRLNISNEAKQLNLHDAVSKYGERLALVACQAARDAALAGVHSEDLETLVINSYIMLERIGRSREHGESTQGRQGLSRLNIPPKSAFYFRKRLLANGMLSKQAISMRISNRNVLGTLLHLPRFASLKLPKLLILIKRLIEILKNTPNHMLDYNAMREKLATTVQLKKILATNELRQYVEIEHVPFRSLFPEATVKEWKMKNSDAERTIKVARLIDPSVDLDNLFLWEEPPPEDGSVISEEEETSGSGILTNACIQEHHHAIIRQAYKIVEASGSEGSTQAALAEKLGLSQLDARSTLRALTRLQLVDCITKEVKKNRVFLYVTKTHFADNAIRAQYEQEQMKVREFLQNTVNENSNDTYSRSGTPDSPAPTSSNVQLEKDVSLREEDVKEEKGLFRPNVSRKILVNQGEAVNSELTHRSLRRVNIILEAVRTHTVIEGIGGLRKLITDEESREGVNALMDRRSLRRLLARLACEGQIKRMRIVMRCGNKEKELDFVCLPGVDQNNSIIRSAVNQAKLKLFCIARNQLSHSGVKHEKRAKVENVEIDPSVTQSVQDAKENLPFKRQAKMIRNFSSGRFYGAEPKCIRVKEMHRLFFYLVYGYTGKVNEDQALLKEELMLNHPEVDESMLEEIPDLFQSKVGWQMFLEPLPSHNGWGQGWCFFCDILLRLPLSIFVKVVNITYEINGLADYLKHPIKKHLLLQHLPMEIRQGLIYARKYIFTIYDIVTNMVFLGLAQFGPANPKEKDLVFIYLNRRTTILDTTPSAAGYHHISRDIEYEKKDYYFECMEDVEKYWYEVWHVCTNTMLGSINTMAGQSITLEFLRKKPAMIEAVRPRISEEAPKLDTGEVPGDHLGAAGFDSAFFAHLKRNWSFNKVASVHLNRLEQQVKKSGQDGGIIKSPLEPQVSNAAPGRLAGLRKNVTRFTECTNVRGEVLSAPVTTEPNAPQSRAQKRKRNEQGDSTRKITPTKVTRKRMSSTSKPIAKTRLVKARKSRAPRRPYYDEKDRQALMLMRRLRVTWSAAEDSFLLLCKVASTYVTGSLRTTVPFCVVRDCLHETRVESRNKTSRACQRRVAYMMRNPATEYQVVNAYQELEQDPEIFTISGGGPITKSDRSVSAEKTEEISVERFRKVLDYLKSRYSQGVSGGTSLKLPNSIEEFYEQYELVQSNTNLRNRRPLVEVHNIVDVYCSVVYNVIHSSMCTSEDKASWGFHLFNIYQQYPDSLVRSTLAKMKSDMMIAQRKRSMLKNKKYFDSPLSAVPYKLSITYIHLFLSRYQYQMFHRSYQHLASLMEKEKRAISDGMDLSSEDWPGIELGPHDGGSAALAVSLFSLGLARFRFQIPEQIIIFDPKLKDHPEELDNLVKRYNNWVRDIDKAQQSNKDERVVSQRRRLGLTTAAAAGVNAVMPKLITEDIRSASGGELQNQSANLPSSNASESTPRTGYDRHQSQLIIRTASRIGLHMLREDMVQDTQNTTGKPAPNHIQQEHFVINSCKVFIDLESKEPLERGWLLLSPKKRQEVLDSVQTSLPQEIIKMPVPFLDYYNGPECNQAVKVDAQKIVQTIAAKKEMGILITDLPRAIGELSCTNFPLEQHIRILTDCKAIINVGVVTGRYVLSQFISPWVIQSFRLLRSGKEKLEPFDGSKISKQTEDSPEMHSKEETSSTRNNQTPPGDQSGAPKSVQKGKRDRHVSLGSEAEPSEMHLGEETHENATKCAESEPSRSDAVSSPNGQECIATRRKRRAPAPAQQSAKRAKTIDTLGNEDRIDLLVLVKPWVKIDGSLNRRVLDRLLGAIHSHIMTKPGCTVHQIAERFHPALQAFHTRELIEILEKLGCVQLYSIVRKGKPGPFAPRTTLTKVPANMFMGNEEIFCDPAVDGIVKLGEFIGDKKYERDYIPRCSCHNYIDS